jgi:hypothetical protein
MSEQLNYDEFIEALKSLANRWVNQARDHARDSKSNPNDMRMSTYHRATAEVLHKSAMELAEVIKKAGDAPAPSATAAPKAEPVPPAAQYARVELREVMQVLDYAGVMARDITPHKDNAFTAVFSRWQPLSDQERLDKIKSADGRIVILDSGKLKDTQDPYVDFAFKA